MPGCAAAKRMTAPISSTGCAKPCCGKWIRRREAIPTEQISLCLFVQLQQMLQVRVAPDALQLIGDNLPGFLLDAVVVFLYHFLHAVDAVGIPEVGDDRYLPVAFFLFRHLLGIDHNLAMENLLLDFLSEVVRHRTDEHALRQRGNLARRDKAVHLGGDGGGHVVTVDGDGLPFLENLAEPLGERLGGLAHHLPGEDVADGVDDDLRLLVGIVADELREVLKASSTATLLLRAVAIRLSSPLMNTVGSSSMMMELFSLPFLFTSLTMRELYSPSAAP